MAFQNGIYQHFLNAGLQCALGMVWQLKKVFGQAGLIINFDLDLILRYRSQYRKEVYSIGPRLIDCTSNRFYT